MSEKVAVYVGDDSSSQNTEGSIPIIVLPLLILIVILFLINRHRKAKSKEVTTHGIIKSEITERSYSGRDFAEVRYTCSTCGNIWHMLPVEEKYEKDKAAQGCLQMGCGCLPLGLWQIATSKDVSKCPKCGSRNVSRDTILYKK